MNVSGKKPATGEIESGNISREFLKFRDSRGFECTTRLQDMQGVADVMSKKIKASNGDNVIIKIPSYARISSEEGDIVASWDVDKKCHYLRVKPDGSVLYQRGGTVWKHENVVSKGDLSSLGLKVALVRDSFAEKMSCNLLNEALFSGVEKSAVGSFIRIEYRPKIADLSKFVDQLMELRKGYAQGFERSFELFTKPLFETN
jgi:hypothetical protein